MRHMEVFSSLWLYYGVDGDVPDSFDLIGSVIAIIGVVIIFYTPRKGERAIWSR